MDSSTHKPGSIFLVEADESERRSLTVFIESIGLRPRPFPSLAAYRVAELAEEPGCLVLALAHPVEPDLRLYEQLVREGGNRPAIVLARYPEVRTVVRAMKTGAVDFLETPIDRKLLLDQINVALRLDQERRRERALLNETEALLERLSPRERDTLELLLAGESNKVMAGRLGITERAIEMRRANILKKLRSRNLAELMGRIITYRALTRIITSGTSWGLPKVENNG